MAKSVKGTQTEKNLLTSFAGESQARMRYTYFAEKAKEEGFEQIAAIFMETAEQEREHAKRMFKHLEGGMVEINACYPAGVIGTTAENLKAAAEEGFPAIAAMYRAIAVAEKAHEERYMALLKNVEEYTVFKKDGKVYWQCRNCGYVIEASEAPKACPACLYPQAYFEVQKTNY